MDLSKAFRKSTRGPKKGEGWELSIRLTPKAAQTKIGEAALSADGVPYLKVCVTAIPENNKANKALLDLLAKTFGIPKSRLHIISGLTDRHKVIWFDGDVSF
jgi:uncharacterized protein YggU (UPF0235/DUF167 family)